MYLSELFLQKLENGTESENVINALKACNIQFCNEMDVKEGDGIPSDLLLSVDAQGKVAGLNRKGQELLDFWDAYKEFDGIIPEEKKEKMSVVHAAIALRNRVDKITAME